MSKYEIIYAADVTRSLKFHKTWEQTISFVHNVLSDSSIESMRKLFSIEGLLDLLLMELNHGIR